MPAHDWLKSDQGRIDDWQANVRHLNGGESLAPPANRICEAVFILVLTILNSKCSGTFLLPVAEEATAISFLFLSWINYMSSAALFG